MNPSQCIHRLWQRLVSSITVPQNAKLASTPRECCRHATHSSGRANGRLDCRCMQPRIRRVECKSAREATRGFRPELK
eukprot:scaffold57725_cov31-Tisochrysis_lutea.AAC.1